MVLTAQFGNERSRGGRRRPAPTGQAGRLGLKAAHVGGRGGSERLEWKEMWLVRKGALGGLVWEWGEAFREGK